MLRGSREQAHVVVAAEVLHHRVDEPSRRDGAPAAVLGRHHHVEAACRREEAPLASQARQSVTGSIGPSPGQRRDFTGGRPVAPTAYEEIRQLAEWRLISQRDELHHVGRTERDHCAGQPLDVLERIPIQSLRTVQAPGQQPQALGPCASLRAGFSAVGVVLNGRWLTRATIAPDRAPDQPERIAVRHCDLPNTVCWVLLGFVGSLSQSPPVITSQMAF